MNDLNTIRVQNAKAVQAHIPNIVASGKHVVAKYTGLHFHSYSEHDTLGDAEVAANEYAAQSPGNSTRIHSPSHAAA